MTNSKLFFAISLTADHLGDIIYFFNLSAIKFLIWEWLSETP